MTYFADLTQYEFLDSDHGAKNFLNIGWIDRAYPYPKGPTPQGVMNRLIEELAQPRNRTRGYHRCNLCGEREPTRFTVGDKDIVLGDAEIHIELPDRVYVSPNLVIHYIDEHSYRPPEEFLQAALGLRE